MEDIFNQPLRPREGWNEIMRYYPGFGLARDGETFDDLRKKRADAIRHNRRVDRLQRHFENQRQRPMQSMVDWATERGIYEKLNP